MTLEVKKQTKTYIDNDVHWCFHGLFFMGE